MKNREPKTGRRRTGLTLQFPSEYNSWKGLRARCWYKSNPSFKYVGARGLGVCVRWAESFAAFLEDMGPKPSPMHSIDRIDNNRGYEPDNCRWATPREQQINSSKAVFLEFQGERLCLSDWARKTGIPSSIISCRMHRLGWTIEQTLIIHPQIGQTPIEDLKRASRPKVPVIGMSERNKSSGFFGVTWNAKRNTWQAFVQGVRPRIYCGQHATKESAIAAVIAKAKEIAERAAQGPSFEE